MRFIYLLCLLFLFQNCNESKEKDPIIYDTLEFTDEFFAVNSEKIFVDEIERVTVNYFEEANFLIYTFKNYDILKDNDLYFLNIEANDSLNLPLNRRAYGTINLSIKKDEILKLDETRNFLIKKLQFPFDIKSFRTGIIDNESKKWNFKYTDFENLNAYEENAALIENDSLIIFNKFKQNKPKFTIGNLGVKVYANSDKKIEIYYNVNNNTVTSYFGNLSKVKNNGEFKTSLVLSDNRVVNKSYNLNSIIQENNIGIKIDKFNPTASNIKTVTFSQNDWKETVDLFKLVHYTHLKGIKYKDYNAYSQEKKNAVIVDFLLNNTLKALYNKNNTEIFISGSRQSVYLKVNPKKIKNKISVRVFDENNNEILEILDLDKKKRLVINKSKKSQEHVYHIRVPFKTDKIEFLKKNTDSISTAFYTFKK